ncbi:hypothetical protein MP228_010276 [Amoeboaphelidium protococcarum]|nr:hypothetical protein MP228_010276 [Amoeboaphelidium protococcarum]
MSDSNRSQYLQSLINKDFASDKVMKRFEIKHKLGEGTYAVVHSGTDKVNQNQMVAVKMIKIGQFRDGLDMSAIREIKFLNELSHENVVKLLAVYTNGRNINLVLEYLPYDLEILIKDKSTLLSSADIKSYMGMILRGVEHIHRHYIIHRDLKPNNMLISASGLLKVADFGLARSYGEPTGNMSTQVVTRWYRAPEILFGARDYGDKVDMWSMGCIFAELMLRTPFLVGDTDLQQLETIFRALGTPSQNDWPGLDQLPNYVELTKYPKPQLRQLFNAASSDTLDLMAQMFCYYPLKRISAKEALLHDYLKREPYPTSPENLPKIKQAVDNKSQTQAASTAASKQESDQTNGKRKVAVFTTTAQTGKKVKQQKRDQ